MSGGMGIALTSYALAAVISFITAGLMALILKVVQRLSKKG
jgi:hypothetical protein